VFNVKVANKILNHAERSGVSVISNSIIYRLLEEVRTRVQALLPPIIEQRVLGEAIVQLLFDIKGKGKSIIKIAGCRVTNGIIVKAKRIRIVRDGEEVYSGSFQSPFESQGYLSDCHFQALLAHFAITRRTLRKLGRDLSAEWASTTSLHSRKGTRSNLTRKYRSQDYCSLHDAGQDRIPDRRFTIHLVHLHILSNNPPSFTPWRENLLKMIYNANNIGKELWGNFIVLAQNRHFRPNATRATRDAEGYIVSLR
jgi:hypothetical protein